MGIDGSPGLNTAEEETRCARHPDVETGLLCGRCGTPICPRCMVQTPVGARCPDCANVRRIPTVDVPLQFVARGLGAAVVAGAAVGAAWGYAFGPRGFGFLFLFFIAIGIGYVVGEAISLATNRKRGTALQACAILGVVTAYIVHNIVAGETPIPQGDVFGYLATAAAAYFAAQRVNY